MDIRNKVGIVTGGADGIGRCIAESFYRAGAKVIVFDIDSSRLKNLSNKMPDITTVRVDVSIKEDVFKQVDKVMGKFGEVNILVNNAGICECKPVLDIAEKSWDRMMNINLKSVFFMSQAVIPFMKKKKQGKIVNIASIAGKIGGMLTGTHYSVSKAGVICFTKCLARELAPYSINVNCVCPSIVNTDMTRLYKREDIKRIVETIPLGRIPEPEEVANAVLFLSSESSNFITGEIMDVNGGSLMD